jgi:hypothetical protein
VEEEKNIALGALKFLFRLIFVTFIAALTAYFLVTEGALFFKWFEGKVDLKNPIGFSVILFLAVLCQVLVWATPCAIPAVLVRPIVRCIGAWFDFSIRMVFVVLASIFIRICTSMYFENKNLAKGDEFRNLLLTCFAQLHSMLTMSVVEVLNREHYMMSDHYSYLLTFALFLMLLAGYIKKVYLSEKEVKRLTVFSLVLIVTILSSYVFFMIQPYLGTEWKQALFLTSFWEIDTQVTPEAVVRSFCSWIVYLFAALILQLISKDKDKTIEQVASPVFTRVNSS